MAFGEQFFDNAANAVAKAVMGNLPSIESDFRELKLAHPNLSFPECVSLYENEKGVKLNSVQTNHALNGFEAAAKELS